MLITKLSFDFKEIKNFKTLKTFTNLIKQKLYFSTNTFSYTTLISMVFKKAINYFTNKIIV